MHFSVQVTAAVCVVATLLRRLTVLVVFAGVAVRFLEEEAVLVLDLLVVFFAVFLLVCVTFLLAVALFFLSTVLSVWETAGVVLACLEAWATDVKGSVVKSKAQSVIEIRFIRATEQSSVRAGLSCLRVIFKT
ncbi:hypothetical protein D3C73_1240050 [compost metagenome]